MYLVLYTEVNGDRDDGGGTDVEGAVGSDASADRAEVKRDGSFGGGLAGMDAPRRMPTRRSDVRAEHTTKQAQHGGVPWPTDPLTPTEGRCTHVLLNRDPSRCCSSTSNSTFRPVTATVALAHSSSILHIPIILSWEAAFIESGYEKLLLNRFRWRAYGFGISTMRNHC